MKYVHCDWCKKKIEFGSKIFNSSGYCGIYCSAECFAKEFAREEELEKEIAKRHYCEIFEE